MIISQSAGSINLTLRGRGRLWPLWALVSPWWIPDIIVAREICIMRLRLGPSGNLSKNQKYCQVGAAQGWYQEPGQGADHLHLDHGRLLRDDVRADGGEDTSPVLWGQTATGRHLRDGLALFRSHHSGFSRASLCRRDLRGDPSSQEEPHHHRDSRVGEHQVYRLPHTHLPPPLQQHDDSLWTLGLPTGQHVCARPEYDQAVNSDNYSFHKIFPVKYVLGSSPNLLVPLAILLTKSDVWQMTKKVAEAGMEKRILTV